jgi:hypothetical protein
LAAATELRMRAFTVLVRTYDEARAAIGYLRRKEDDADTIAPNLYPGRPARRKQSGSGDPTQVPAGTVPAGTAPATTPAAPTTSATPGASVSPTPAPAPHPTGTGGPFMS